MEKELKITGRYSGTLMLDYLPSINYALVLNGGKTFNRFELTNLDSQDWDDVKICITGDMIEPCQLTTNRIANGESIDYEGEAMLMPITSKLMALDEAVQTSFTVTIYLGEEQVASHSLPLLLMAFDQWHGVETRPELLASFVTPNNPCINPICSRAADYLERINGNRDLTTYNYEDYQYIIDQVESVWQALLDEKITYITAPASFESCGQRIRLSDQILKDKLGNCIDLSLLLCSCLESMGVHTFVVLFRSHAIMGVWLSEDCINGMVGSDINMLQNTPDEGPDLLLLEATALTRGASFKEAMQKGQEAVADPTMGFKCYIDIHAARLNHIRPLPYSTYTKEKGWEVMSMPDYDKLFEEWENEDSHKIHGTAPDNRLQNKQILWEHKLLDLTLRNNLLNMKSGKHIVPLKGKPIDEILSHLHSEQLLNDLDEKDNFATIKELYRAARTSLEENGANTLFLSLGTLRWYEVDSQKPLFAPILFLPVEIVHTGARQYKIRMRDEEPLMNITLLEMMRQVFDLEIPPLMPVPEDENEQADWRRVFSVLNTVVNEVNLKQKPTNQWEIVEECMIGIFSFTKFVMWNDIHTCPETLENQPLLRSMMEGRLLLPAHDTKLDVRSLDATSKPSDYAIPLDADSSQLEAIVNAGQGKSFYVIGPPGTGKSQSITNMIANSLYQNKRVLFVAEKKAALEVVQERLRRIGLDPFCLELHSNKVDKKSFLTQMEEALDVTRQASPEQFQQQSEELYAKRQELNGYIEALHKKREFGLSLFDYICRYLEIEGDVIPLPYEDISSLTLEQVEAICEEYRQLDLVEEIIGTHPCQHPLLGLFPHENTADNQQLITKALSTLPSQFDWARKREQLWWNRWFLHRTALEFLLGSKAWTDLSRVADVDDRIQQDIQLLEPPARSWSKNTDKLRLWYHFSPRYQHLLTLGLLQVSDYYMQGHSGKQTADALLRGFYHCHSMHIIDNDPTLRAFNGLLFEEVIRKYRQLNSEFQELTKQELVSRLSHRTPSIEEASSMVGEEITFLRKRIAGKGRGYTIRRMLDETRHIMPRLCPCMLMSPLSVSQYLEMATNQFDLVIFDEASQMPTSEAVGAIARGKSVIVVGDPKQMPPTSFFQSNNTNEDDIDIDDMESVLDDCISLSLSNCCLQWHYRSKHESLIAFSNTHFYDGELFTFPSIDDQDRKVTLQHVEGYYDYAKSRSNREEAKAIVNEVLDRLQRQLPSEEGEKPKEPQRSIGIVAFSKVQSTLIEDMLTDALAKHPKLEKLAMTSEEPIFIKNLENVQGDERDIILFSVGYGPDKNGKVSMNFGPLNQVGGERRLNVAVSRARYEMKVFSTLQPHQIDLQRSDAKGVLGLKRFLEYAETGALPRPSTQQWDIQHDAITLQVAKALRKAGKVVKLYVGHSKFRVDLAIVDPNDPSKYEMGIIVDGPTYHSTPTARDREIVQPSILSALGWNIRHLWTADWIENPQACLTRLLA